MDYTNSSVLALLRGPLLFTPQGWVVLATCISGWSLAGISWLVGGPIYFSGTEDREQALLLVWPFLVFLFYIQLCMPHFQASWRRALALGISAASLPAFELFKVWSSAT